MPGGGREFCDEVARRKRGLTINLSNPLTSLFGANTKSKTTNKSMVQNKALSRAVNDAVSQCSNAATIKQSNVIDTSVCGKVFGCGPPPKHLKGADLRAWLAYTSKVCDVRNITQTNRALSKEECVIQNSVSNLMKQKITAESLAAMERVMEAKGLLSTVESVGNNCSKIDNDVTQEAVVRTVSSCYTRHAMGQSNALLGCARNVKQGNVADAYARCVMSQLSNQSVDQNVDAKSKATDKQNLSAKGLTPMTCAASLLGIGLALGACCLSAFLVSGSTRGKGKR